MKKSKQSKNKKSIFSRFSSKFYSYLPIVGLAIFLVYRSGLVVEFINNFPLTNQAAASKVFMPYECREDSIENETADISYSDYAVRSDLYDAKIARPSTSPNYVKNNNFAILDTGTKRPVGFVSNNEATNVDYSTPSENGQMFLRADQKVEGKQELGGSWLHDTVAVDEQKTYGFSLDYRSGTDATITLELTHADGSMSYEYIARIRPSANWQTYSGNFEDSQYKAKSVRIIVSPENKGIVDTRAYSIYELPSGHLSEGVISVTFDDGWDSVYTTARPLLQKYKIPTTQYIVAENSINNVSGYMNIKEIKQLASEGHEIGSHSLRHCNQAKLDQHTLTYDADTSKAVLAGEGLNVTSYAYPFGSYSDETTATLRKDYGLIRSSDDGFNDRYYDPLNLRAKTIYANTSLEEVQSWIKEARDNHLWLILMYHRVDESGEYNVTSGQMEAQLQAIQKSGLPVMTVSQVGNAIKN